MPPLRTGTASETRVTGCSPLRGRPGGTLPGSVVGRPQPSKGVQRRAAQNTMQTGSRINDNKTCGREPVLQVPPEGGHGGGQGCILTDVSPGGLLPTHPQ